jgi:hypothetical protein
VEQTYEYNPKDVTFVFAGVVAQMVTEDGGITFTRNADMYSLSTAVDGIPTRVKSNNFSGRFTVTLQQSSPTNAEYNALATADEINGTGKGPAFLRDASGTSLVTCTTAWIVKRPDLSFNNSLQDRQWVFETGYATVVNGGNSYA